MNLIVAWFLLALDAIPALFQRTPTRKDHILIRTCLTGPLDACFRCGRSGSALRAACPGPVVHKVCA